MQIPPPNVAPEELPGPEEVRRLLAELRHERERLWSELQRRQELERAASRELEEPRDSADLGGAQGEVDRFGALADLAAARIAAIDEALEQAAQGRFAICQNCAEPIAIGRLRAEPDTVHCIDCARREGT